MKKSSTPRSQAPAWERNCLRSSASSGARLTSQASEDARDVVKAWEQEVARRIAEFDTGNVKPIPAAEVFARLRRIAPDRADNPLP